MYIYILIHIYTHLFFMTVVVISFFKFSLAIFRKRFRQLVTTSSNAWEVQPKQPGVGVRRVPGL